MAIRKKGFRPIHVDGVDYQWKVTGDYIGAMDATVFIIQKDHDRQALTVKPDYKRPNSPRGDQLPPGYVQPHRDSAFTILPSDVAYFIRLAIKNGWNPENDESNSRLWLAARKFNDHPLIKLN